MGGNIALVGMPGSGKTTVGRALAELACRPFVDLDEWIEKKAGLSIPVLIATLGVPGFRALERETLREAAALHEVVLATGGGAVIFPENRALLRACARVYFLKRDVESLPTTGRPLSRDLPKLYAERLPLYMEAAHAEIDNNGSIERTAQAIWEAYCKGP